MIERAWTEISGRRILLTGHTGFKGAWMLALLERLGAQVCGLSLEEPVSSPSLYELIARDPDRNWGATEDHRFSVTDLDRLNGLLNSFSPEIVLHFAAQPLVRQSYSAPYETFCANTLGVLNLMECVRKRDTIRTVLCVTTDKVYRQDTLGRPFREEDPLGARDPYSASKAAAEHIAHSYLESFFRPGGIGLATARAGNVIGGGDWAPDRIIPDLVRAASEGEPAALRNPTYVRPWQHVLDASAGYLSLLVQLCKDPGRYSGAWNFEAGGNGQHTVADLADSFYSAMGHGCWEDGFETEAPHEERHLALESGKARSELGWAGRWGFHEAVRRTALWYAGWLEGECPRALVERDLDAFLDTSSPAMKTPAEGNS